MKLGIQNYTLRDLLAKDFFGTLEKVRQLGLRYCQISGGLYGHTPAAVLEHFKRMDMKAVAVHVGLDQLNNDFERVIEEATILEYGYIVLPWVDKAQYGQGWAKFAKELEPIARKVHERGFRFLYHNHSFEFAKEPDGKVGYDAFFEAADPKLIGAELDTYWVKHGGYDPAAYIRKLKGRVPVLHFKDMGRDEKRSFVEPGQGVLDWDDIIAACKEAGSEYAFIELDTCPREHIESVRISTEFLRSKGLTE